MCAYLNKEDSQGTMTLTDNREKRLTTKNEGSTMHDDSCIGINYAHRNAHRFPKCFRSLHTFFRSVLRVVNSIINAVPIYSISDLYANS